MCVVSLLVICVFYFVGLQYFVLFVLLRSFVRFKSKNDEHKHMFILLVVTLVVVVSFYFVGL